MNVRNSLTKALFVILFRNDYTAIPNLLVNILMIENDLLREQRAPP